MASADGRAAGGRGTVATPPNAIVYGTGLVTMPQMARVGCLLDLFFVLFLAVIALWLAPLAPG
ncbi:MAG TPA: anion permease [Thermoanaerobaculia bacterium]|nr:anion permease [Thermoanaerobaculia bacterium]